MEKNKDETEEQDEKQGRVKVGDLKLNKETLKDLTGNEAKQIQGGARRATAFSCDAGCE